MNYNEKPLKEIESLLSRLESESATDKEKKQLADLLRRHPDAIDAYLDHTEMDAMLRETYGLLNLPCAASPKSECIQRVRLPRRRSVITSIALSAGVIAAIMLWSDSWRAATDFPPSHSEQSSTAPLEIASLPPVAVVARNAGADLYEVRNGFVSATIGEEVPPGRYNLRSGVLEMEYESGAQIILQSPVLFEMEPNDRVILIEGRLAVRCPTEESKGFTVETPSSTAVDLGTEFAVEVSPGGYGIDEYHVFSGKVVVSPKFAPGPREMPLHEGQASRLDHRTSTPAGIDVDYQRFIRGFDGVSKDYNEQILGLEPVVYYSMQAEGDGLALHNEMGDYAEAEIRSAHPSHLNWAPGFNGGTAFNVTGMHTETYAVAEDYPKAPGDQLSATAWVYAKSRPVWASIAKNWQHGLEPNRRGQFHFGLHELTGELEAHINDNDDVEQFAIEDIPLPLNCWHHVAMVADGTVLRLYRNGVEVASTPYNGLNGNPDIKPLAIGTKLGDDSMSPAGQTNMLWNGCIDHLAIFNKALTPDQVIELYEIGDASMREYRIVP